MGLRFCARAFSSCGKWGPLFLAVRGPLTIAASLAAEHRLSSCGSRAQLLRGMWDLPRPGLEPVSPALAGRFSTTAPPGKPAKYLFEVSENKVVIFSIPLHEHAEFSLWNTRGSVGPQMKKRSAEVQNYLSQLGGEKKDQVPELCTSYGHLG